MSNTADQDRAYFEAALEQVAGTGLTPAHRRFISADENASTDHEYLSDAWYASFRATLEFHEDMGSFEDE